MQFNLFGNASASLGTREEKHKNFIIKNFMFQSWVCEFYQNFPPDFYCALTKVLPPTIISFTENMILKLSNLMLLNSDVSSFSAVITSNYIDISIEALNKQCQNFVFRIQFSFLPTQNYSCHAKHTLTETLFNFEESFKGKIWPTNCSSIYWFYFR